ncbi:MAG: hypothetical protein QM765_26430 [Myxococcales bacterium]
MTTRPASSGASSWTVGARATGLSPLSRVSAPERQESTTSSATATGACLTKETSCSTGNRVPFRCSSPASACEET